ncbi:MAG TPA: hypothetical protein VHB69_11850 [Mycobacteriales bacterium]|nr:hypothetical protein [Mycobacteriales bacterium]
MKRLVVSIAAVAVVGAAVAGVAGCGGGSKEPPGHALAAKACQSAGQQAADYATQAAAANPVYATLAADERAAALQEAQAGAAAGLGSGTAAQLLGAQGVGFKVIGDCASLGLAVTH